VSSRSVFILSFVGCFRSWLTGWKSLTSRRAPRRLLTSNRRSWRWRRKWRKGTTKLVTRARVRLDPHACRTANVYLVGGVCARADRTSDTVHLSLGAAKEYVILFYDFCFKTVFIPFLYYWLSVNLVVVRKHKRFKNEIANM